MIFFLKNKWKIIEQEEKEQQKEEESKEKWKIIINQNQVEAMERNVSLRKNYN